MSPERTGVNKGEIVPSIVPLGKKTAIFLSSDPFAASNLPPASSQGNVDLFDAPSNWCNIADASMPGKTELHAG